MNWFEGCDADRPTNFDDFKEKIQLVVMFLYSIEMLSIRGWLKSKSVTTSILLALSCCGSLMFYIHRLDSLSTPQ